MRSVKSEMQNESFKSSYTWSTAQPVCANIYDPHKITGFLCSPQSNKKPETLNVHHVKVCTSEPFLHLWHLFASGSSLLCLPLSPLRLLDSSVPSVSRTKQWKLSAGQRLNDIWSHDSEMKSSQTNLHFGIKTLERDATIFQVLTGNKTLLLEDQVPERGKRRLRMRPTTWSEAQESELKLKNKTKVRHWTYLD